MKGFLLDLNRCTGCHACRLACSIENELGAGNSWREIYTFNEVRLPGIPRFHLSLGCQHCVDAACMRTCPASAYRRDLSTGAVLVDSERCIGCGYCRWACPFDAPHYSRVEGTVSKCTLCYARVADGKSPACANLCPTGALQFTELDSDAGIQGVPGFPATNLEPAMRFLPLRAPSAVGPELEIPSGESAPEFGPAAMAFTRVAKAADGSEWSLVLFTLAASLLVALAGAAVLGSLRLEAPVFLVALAGAMAVGSLHLGKPQRAWRAVLNLRGSWLSREILFYLAFAILAAAIAMLPGERNLILPVVLAGLATLFSVDMVYGAVSQNHGSLRHSAGAVLTGLFLYGILTGNAFAAGLTGLVKLVLYAFRKDWFGSAWRPLATLLRLTLGFVIPLAIWSEYPGWVLLPALMGELIDRIEYYADLNIPSPVRQMTVDLQSKR